MKLYCLLKSVCFIGLFMKTEFRNLFLLRQNRSANEDLSLFIECSFNQLIKILLKVHNGLLQNLN